MKKIKVCVNCKKKLTKDEIALNKKIISPNTTEFQCLECMSESLDCSVDDLKIKIDEFKEAGCTLFA